MSLGLFEPAETRLLSTYLQPGDTFIDVGAHIGWFTTLASRAVGPHGQVIACEPYPSNLALLRENLALNHAGNVRVLDSAVGSSTGTLCLAKGDDSGGVTALDWVATNQVSVPVTTLDAVAAEVPAVAMLKIDVEGWEAHVLRGATGTLLRTRRVLIEMNQPALQAAGSSQEELLDQLRNAGFTSFVAVRQGGVRRMQRDHSVTNVLASRSPA